MEISYLFLIFMTSQCAFQSFLFSMCFIMGVCLARYFMHIYDVIVLDIGSSECDSEVKATEVLQFSGNFY